MDTPPPANIFDFIDFIEAQNFTPTTANEARAFIFENLNFLNDTTYDPNEVYAAFADVGVTVPQSVFNSIIELHNTNPGESNVIQILAPTSPIPGQMLPIEIGNYNNKYITRYDIDFYDPEIDEYLQKSYYITYSDDFTPSQLKQAASKAFSAKYNVEVIAISLRRSSQTFSTR